ncbi:MAG: PAS domain-containing protein [Steroidobacteraceae bacterium]
MPTGGKHTHWQHAFGALRGSVAPASGDDPRNEMFRLLALLGSAAPLNELLDGLARDVETWSKGVHCTFLIVDSTCRVLQPGAAPSLPPSYIDAIGQVAIAVGQGSCGTAAALREMVFVEDVERSDLWAGHAHIALSYGLRACWSAPIVDDAGTVLGTLALYFREPRAPTTAEIEFMQGASSLASFVIQRHRDSARLRASEARLAAAVWGTDIGLWECAGDGNHTWFDDWSERFDIEPGVGPRQERHWRDRIHPEDIHAYASASDAAVNGFTDHYVAEYRILTRGGEWRWLHERGKVSARDVDGKALRFVGVCMCVDEQKKLEAALRAAENSYELAVGAARLPVWHYDVRSDTVTGNAYWHRTVGHELTDAEAPHRVETWLSDVHPDDAERYSRLLTPDATDDTGFYQSEFRIRLPGGEYKWLLDRGRVVERSADGAPIKAVGISLDIDAQKRLELDLRESEQRFRGAFEFAAIGMALVASDGRWLRVNRSLCRIVGYTAEELLATDFQSITHPEDLGTDVERMRQMLDGTLSHYDIEKRYVHKHGHIVWVLLSVSLVRGAAAESTYFVSQIQDITERKLAERRLIDSEQRYRTVADLVPGFVFEGVVRDGHPHPIWVSDGFQRVYGCTLEKIMELGGDRDFCDAAPWVQIPAGASESVCESDVGTDVSLKNADGAQRWLRVVARRVRDGAGTDVDRVLGVAEDVTERKRLESALREATYREHQRLGQEIHDGLGQELTGIAYLASSLATEAARASSPLAPDLTRLAEVARHAIESCRSIARGVSPLTESRGSLLQSLRQISDLAAASGHASVSFEAIEHASLTLPSESCDQLHRITQEALNNALKHAGADHIKVSIQVDPTKVRIKVIDDGRGLIVSREAPGGRGIDGMRQRASSIGARLRVETRHGGGAAVVCECPQSAPGEIPAM